MSAAEPAFWVTPKVLFEPTQAVSWRASLQERGESSVTLKDRVDQTEDLLGDRRPDDLASRQRGLRQGLLPRNRSITRADPAPIDGGERPMLGFETLTLAPYDRDLIDLALLTPEDRAQVDAYHARVLAVIGPKVDAGARAWLEQACAPL